MQQSNAKLSSLEAWSDASTREHVVGPAAGGFGALPYVLAAGLETRPFPTFL